MRFQKTFCDGMVKDATQSFHLLGYLSLMCCSYLLMDAIEKASYIGMIKTGMDVAASEYYTKEGNYNLNFKSKPNDGAHVLSPQSLGDLYREFVKDFPIVSI